MTVKTFIFNPIEVNTYVLYDETKECAVIDAGCLSLAEKHELQDFIDSNNLKIKHLLNTHLHLDHQFGNRFMFETYGIAPAAHREDEFFIAQLAEDMRRFGFYQHVENQPLGRHLTEDDDIRFGNIVLKILHVPGHSPGSLCFYCEADGVLFSGDVLFRSGIGRTDLTGGNYETLIDSIRKKLLTLPDNTIVHCGHATDTTIGKEKKYNPYL